jgi:UDP-galactopyranose mutase
VLAAARPVVVVGAGPTGLSAAYHLGDEAVLLEQADRVGGWCRSIETNGFTFDYAGHIMFTNDDYVRRMYRMLLGDNVHWQDREAWIFSKGVHTRYPFQGALYGLPHDVVRECLLGAIEARLAAAGVHSAPRATPPRDCCADGIAEATVPSVVAPAAPANFEEFIYRVWGAGIAKHFAIPYNHKLWAVPLSEMETSWLGGRVPMPDIGDMIDGALAPVPRPFGPNARFGYPLRGGFQALMDGFLPKLRGPLHLRTRIAKVSAKRHEVYDQHGTAYPYEVLISTMPLPVLVRLLGREAPEPVRRAAKQLRHVSVRCVHLGIGRPALTEKHWIYYPEDTVFHRIFVQGNASPHCNPPGGFGLTCEITYSPDKPLPAQGQALIERCLADCRRVGLVRDDDPVWASLDVDLPHAYVVYDHGRAEHVAKIRAWLEGQDIVLAGRYAEWEYYNSDHAFLAGRKAAEMAAAIRGRSAPMRATADARATG